MGALGRRLRQRTVRFRLTVLYGALFLLSGGALLAITYLLTSHAISQPVRVPPAPHVQPGAAAASGIVHGNAPASVSSQNSANLHQLLKESGLALIFMGAVSIALGWLVAGRALRPLRTITRTTQRISGHNLHERLALPGPRDELTALADTIDKLLARLERSFESQRRFVANASHELRTPLTVSQALLQVALGSRETTFASLRATCNDVLETNRELEQLIDALLTLAAAGRTLERRERVELDSLAARAADAEAAEALVRGIEIERSLAPAAIDGDPLLVERLIRNLLANAIRHNHHGGSVALEVDSGARGARMRVSNTGPVVPEREIDRLLEPFERLEAGRAAQTEGSGLGLSIVKTIADAHDATLSVRPGPGGGLDVCVSFAAVEGVDPALAAIPAAESLAGGGAPAPPEHG